MAKSKRGKPMHAVAIDHEAQLKPARRGRAAEQAKTKQDKPELAKAKSTQVSMRVEAATRQIIDRAANVLGQTRTEFILSTARERAIEVLLNRQYFELPEEDWNRFNAALDAPPKPNAALKALLSEEAPWDEQSKQRTASKRG